MDAKEIYAALEQQVPGKVGIQRRGSGALFDRGGSSIVEVCIVSRSRRMDFEVLSDLTALDWPKEEKIQVVYHLFSTRTIIRSCSKSICRAITEDCQRRGYLEGRQLVRSGNL